MMRLLLRCNAIFISVCFSSLAFASDEKASQDLEANKIDEGEIARIVQEYLDSHPQETGPSQWDQVFQQLKFYGDFRFRHESSVKLDGMSDRHRERVRLRFGINYQVAEEVVIGVRARTGNGDDPNSPHATLGDGFDSLEIALDRAHLDYQPQSIEGLRLSAGKFAHAFRQNPVYGELVWDGDIQPEGASVRYRKEWDGFFQGIEAVLGQYFLLEQGADKDAHLTAAQMSCVLKVGDESRIQTAVGYYLYDNTTPEGSRALLGDNMGNATVDIDGDGTVDEYTSTFLIANPMVSLESSVGDQPFVLSLESIQNTQARGRLGQGWAIGGAIGTTQNQGDWRAYYQYQEVEQDAVFSPLAQDDFLFATNHRSHVFGINYQLSSKVGLHLWGLASKLDERFDSSSRDSHQWRARLDLNVKF